MRGPIPVDPDAIDYGRATPSLRALLRRWSAIDWFEPLAADAAPLPALRDHVRLARAHMPERVPASCELRLELGDWSDFLRLCERVRANAAWDWKYGVLKQIAHRHSTACGWTMSATGPDLVGHPDAQSLVRSMLVLRFGTAAIWNGFGPDLDYERLTTAEAEAARWYMSYASMDLIECLEWQLAEPDARLEDNPFEPLLRCHAEGALIFSLGPTQLLAFGFRP